MAENTKDLTEQLSSKANRLERSLKKQRGLQGQINLGKAETSRPF